MRYLTKFEHCFSNIEISLEGILKLCCRCLFACWGKMSVWILPTYLCNWILNCNCNYPSPIFFKLSRKTINIKWSNSPKMKFCFFETKIWCTLLELRKNWILIMQDKKCQLFSISIMQKNLNGTIGNL